MLSAVYSKLRTKTYSFIFYNLSRWAILIFLKSALSWVLLKIKFQALKYENIDAWASDDKTVSEETDPKSLEASYNRNSQSLEQSQSQVRISIDIFET